MTIIISYIWMFYVIVLNKLNVHDWPENCCNQDKLSQIHISRFQWVKLYLILAGVWNLMSFPVGWRSVSSGIAWLCAKRGSYWFLWHVINFPIYSRAPIKYEAVNFNIWRESGKGAGINSRMILMQEAWYFKLSSDKWFRLFCVYQIQTSENNLDYRCVNDLSFHNHIFIWIYIYIYIHISRLNFWGKTYCSCIKKLYIYL